MWSDSGWGNEKTRERDTYAVFTHAVEDHLMKKQPTHSAGDGRVTSNSHHQFIPRLTIRNSIHTRDLNEMEMI